MTMFGSAHSLGISARTPRALLRLRPVVAAVCLALTMSAPLRAFVPEHARAGTVPAQAHPPMGDSQQMPDPCPAPHAPDCCDVLGCTSAAMSVGTTVVLAGELVAPAAPEWPDDGHGLDRSVRPEVPPPRA